MASLLKCFGPCSCTHKSETKSAGKKESTVKSSKARDTEASDPETRRRAIKAMVAQAQGLDLCFLVDATGSMQKYMDMVKNKVTEMMGGIKEAYVECDLRVSVVLYRDYNDHGNEGCDFTTDFDGTKSTFAKSLASARATGGDDTAEDVFTGLERVAKLDWQASSRVLVHICDAPCHGTQFHDLPEKDSNGYIHDHHRGGDKYSRDIADLLQKLHGQCQISRYVFYHVTERTTKMIQEFKKAIEDTDWIQEARIENINTIPQTVVSISRSTIKKTISSATTGLNTHAHMYKQQFVPETVDESRPEWRSIRELEGHLHKHKWYSSLDELLKRIKNGHQIEFEEMDPVTVKIAPNPFSDEGAVRWPYHARVLQLHSKRMVVKRFKIPLGKDARSVHSAERYFSQMEVQTVAAQMAHEFNKRTQSFDHEQLKRVEFTTVSTLYADFKNYNMEEYLEGTWIRHSSNAGYVNTKDYAATLQAFTHWTYERSGGDLMVTDLQGVSQRSPGDGSHMFWLCDPAIHCNDLGRFTGTNLADYGFKLFFRTHKCDDLCGLLGLKPYSGNTTEGKSGTCTTLSAIEESVGS